MNIGEDIDLIEFMKFSCRKYTLIIIVILLFIISGGLFCYLNSDKITVTMNVTPKIYSPFFYTSCNDNSQCRYEIFEMLIASKTDGRFVIRKTNKSNMFTVKATFHKAEKEVIDYNLSSLNAELISWYRDDVNNTLQDLDKFHEEKKLNDIISRSFLIAATTSRHVENNDILVISKPVYSRLYNTQLLLMVSALAGLVCSFLYLIFIYSFQQRNHNTCSTGQKNM